MSDTEEDEHSLERSEPVKLRCVLEKERDLWPGQGSLRGVPCQRGASLR